MFGIFSKTSATDGHKRPLLAGWCITDSATSALFGSSGHQTGDFSTPEGREPNETAAAGHHRPFSEVYFSFSVLEHFGRLEVGLCGGSNSNL